MSSLNREAVFLILQFLDEEKFKDTVHKYGFFFLSTLCCFLFYASLCFLGFQFSLVLNDEYSEIFRNSVFFFFYILLGLLCFDADCVFGYVCVNEGWRKSRYSEIFKHSVKFFFFVYCWVCFALMLIVYLGMCVWMKVRERVGVLLQYEVFWGMCHQWWMGRGGAVHLWVY